MEKNNIIQIVLLAVFGVATIIAVLVFAGKIKIGPKTTSQAVAGEVIVWGTLPDGQMKQVFDTAVKTYKNVRIEYKSFSESAFEPAVVRAIADGKGPDLFFLSQSQVQSLQSLITTVPYTSYPRIQFESTFADLGSLFLAPDGMRAIPVGADPLVLYSNRDLLSAGFISTLPKTWDDVRALAPTLVKKTDAGTVTQALIPVGSPNNVRNHADIVSLFFLQRGIPIVTSTPEGGYQASLASSDRTLAPSTAVSEIIAFSDPRSATVGWSSSLPDSQDQFLAGRSAFYIGYASESTAFSRRNANLDFTVSLIPQRAGASRTVTYARVYGVALAKGAKNTTAAYQIAAWLAAAPQQTLLSSVVGWSPVRRDLLSQPAVDNPRESVLFQSTIAARAWLDPDSVATSAASARMITDSSSGAVDPSDAVQEYSTRLDELIAEQAPPIE
jgi:ABC-type glycerol-3-phosphate transport system substrate-binding protein